MPDVTVSFDQAGSSPEAVAANRETAIKIARELELPFLKPQELAQRPGAFVLRTSENGLELETADSRNSGTIRADFEHPTLAYRSTNRINHQAIIRAAGVKQGRIPSVLDATAGLGKDAYLLATAGCSVVMLEQNRIVHALLRDGLCRASRSRDEKVRLTAGLMRLELTSLAQFVKTQPQFDVVYLDPMFPERRKNARVKKDMFVLQKFFEHGNSEADDARLLSDAMAVARRRVVIKRPRLAPGIDASKPTFSLSGRSSRYDVYVTR